MGILQNVKTRLSAIAGTDSRTQPPVVQTLNWPYQFFSSARTGNLFSIYDAMIDIDADLSGYFDRMAYMCKTAYADIILDVGRRLEPREEEFLTEAKTLAKTLDFGGEFFSTAYDLLKYGDVVKHMVWDANNGVTGLETLPRIVLSAVNHEGQIGKTDEEITKDNFFVINEQEPSNRKVFKRDTCVKFSLNCKSTFIKDIYGRNTYGVWSRPPTRTLLYYTEWKVNTMINDILWSHRNVPREWHQLDLSMFSPDKYQGSREEKERQAFAAAKKAADDYSTSLAGRGVDVGAVTDMSTKISYIEPQSTNYQAPNQKLDQINESMSNAIGLPPVTPKSSYASSLLGSSFATMIAKSIAEIEKIQFENVLKKHMQVKFGSKFEDLIPKLSISLKLILEKDKTEIMRQIAIMVQSRCFTPTEIRSEWGKGPLTDDQKAEIYEAFGSKQQPISEATTTLNEVVENTETTKNTTWPTYPSEKVTPQKRLPK